MLHIGLDLHKRFSTVAVMNDDGEIDIDPRGYSDPTLFKFITIRTTDESTFGFGKNAPGGT